MQNVSVRAETCMGYGRSMATSTTTSAGIARFGALLADETRAEILCALMSGRAHTGSELARHIGVAPSTMSEHLSKLLDAEVVAVEAQGRHRYWRLIDDETAHILESLGAVVNRPDDPRAPAYLAYARTCYDHLAGELAVAIYDSLYSAEHLAQVDDQLAVTPSGMEFFASLGVDTDAICRTKSAKARSCLDWTQRRHHLAGAAGKQLLITLTDKGWVKPGDRPRSMRIPEKGRTKLAETFDLRCL